MSEFRVVSKRERGTETLIAATTGRRSRRRRRRAVDVRQVLAEIERVAGRADPVELGPEPV